MYFLFSVKSKFRGANSLMWSEGYVSLMSERVFSMYKVSRIAHTRYLEVTMTILCH